MIIIHIANEAKFALDNKRILPHQDVELLQNMNVLLVNPSGGEDPT